MYYVSFAKVCLTVKEYKSLIHLEEKERRLKELNEAISQEHEQSTHLLIAFKSLILYRTRDKFNRATEQVVYLKN